MIACLTSASVLAAFFVWPQVALKAKIKTEKRIARFMAAHIVSRIHQKNLQKKICKYAAPKDAPAYRERS